jgi:hypothetical protein
MQKLIEDQHINGIGTHYAYALRHRIVIQELKTIQPKLKTNLPLHINELFFYLLDSAKSGMVLYLCKIYERPKKGSKSRSLGKLLNQIKSSQIDIIRNEFSLKIEWPKFINRHKKLLLKHPDLETKCELFITVVQNKIESFEEKGSLIDKIRIWRDKFIAHDEKYDEKLKMEEEEIDTLLQLANYILDYINTFVNTGVYVITDKSNVTFIQEVLKDYIE